MVWPTKELYHEDSYALDVLSEYLTSGKEAPLNKVLIDDLKLTSYVDMGSYTSEVAGQMQLSVRAFNNRKLDDVKNGIETAFTEFEKNGIPKKDLDRIKGRTRNWFL